MLFQQASDQAAALAPRPLAASVALESYNGGLTFTDNGDGRYYSERTIAGTGYGYGATSSAAIAGDCLIEFSTARSAGLNISIGLSTVKGNFAFTLTNLDFAMQHSGATTGADGWFLGVHQGAEVVGNNLYIERVGEAVKFYVGSSFRPARMTGSILDGTSVAAPDLYLTTLQRSPDICYLRFIAHPGAL